MRTTPLPPDDAGIDELDSFALTFAGYRRLGGSPDRLEQVVRPVIRRLEARSAPPDWVGVDLLRGALYFLQRQAHHWGYLPDDQVEKMRVLVREMRRRFPNHDYAVDTEH